MNKPKIEFISLVSGVDKTMPIIEASKHKPSWIKKAAADFKAKVLSLNNLEVDNKCMVILCRRNLILMKQDTHQNVLPSNVS